MGTKWQQELQLGGCLRGQCGRVERKDNEEKQADCMYCDRYSGVGLKSLGDGQAVRGKGGGEIKEGSLVPGCSNLGGRGRGNRAGVQVKRNRQLYPGPAETGAPGSR